MDRIEAYKILEQTIGGKLTHGNYAKTQEIKSWCDMMMTGQGHEEILEVINHKLTNEQLDELGKIYRPYTRYAINPIEGLYAKMYRSDNIRKTLSHDSEDKIKEIEGALGRFYKNVGVSEYLEENFIDWNFRDPNAILIIERLDRRNNGTIEKIEPYPLLVPSEQVVNIGYDEKGNIEWLILRQERREVVEGRGFGSVVNDWYFYAKDLTIGLFENKSGKEADLAQAKKIDAIQYFEVGQSFGGKGGKFLVKEVENGAKDFVGIHIGAYKEGGVFVPPYYPAKDVLTDVVNHKSQKDIQELKHVFPKLFAIEFDCAHCGGTGKDEEERDCGKCGGRGRKPVHRSGQDYVGVRADHNDEGYKHWDLSKLTYYEKVDTTSPSYFGEELDKDVGRVQIAIFGIVTSEKPNPMAGGKTATEIMAEWDAVNSRVLVMANAYSRIWEHIYRITAQYLELYEGFKVSHNFEKDLKLQSLDQLIANYNAAKEAGLDSDVLFKIECDIVNKQAAGSDEIAWLKVKQKLVPYSNFTEIMASGIVATLERNDDRRIIWENQHEIFTNIKEYLPVFPRLSYKAQVAELKKEIQKYKKEEPLPAIFNPIIEN